MFLFEPIPLNTYTYFKNRSARHSTTKNMHSSINASGVKVFKIKKKGAQTVPGNSNTNASSESKSPHGGFVKPDFDYARVDKLTQAEKQSRIPSYDALLVKDPGEDESDEPDEDAGISLSIHPFIYFLLFFPKIKYRAVFSILISTCFTRKFLLMLSNFLNLLMLIFLLIYSS